MLKTSDMGAKSFRGTLQGEAGSALLTSFMLVVLVTGAGLSALTTTSTNQSKSKNVLNQKQAFYIAEAGISHGRQALYAQLLANPAVWNTYAAYTTAQTLVPSTSFGPGTYAVTIKAASGLALQMTSTSTAPGNASSSISSLVVKGYPNDANTFITDKNLTVSGNATIDGLAGGIHANGNLTISGSPHIALNADASGTYSEPGPGVPVVGGFKGGGQEKSTINRVILSNYTGARDYYLTTGSSTTKDPKTGKRVTTYYALVQNSKGVSQPLVNGMWNCWQWTAPVGGLATWTLTSPCTTKTNATLYVNGHVVILADMGDPTDPNNPWITTILSAGSIRVASSILNVRPPNATTEPTLFKKQTENVLFVAQADILIQGTANQKLYGILRAREQVGISGNPVFYGYITAQDAANISRLVDSSYLSGDAHLTYNGDLQNGVKGTVVVQSTLY